MPARTHVSSRLSLFAPACAVTLLALLGLTAPFAPPRLSIFHFDVNTGDATLIITPDKRGVLIDAGDRGRGFDPVVEFLNRARQNGHLISLDYVITTHYDADHIGGLDEVLNSGWYPTIGVFDRGDTLLPPFDRMYVQTSCPHLDLDEAEAAAAWGSAPVSYCPRSESRASCQIVEYILAAKQGGKRQTLRAGDVFRLDHGVEIVTVAVNAEDADGNRVDVDQPGRRDDCAANDLSAALLVRYGDFRYLVAGDLTGDPEAEVADVEDLIKDDAPDVDVYHINHHGSETSSSTDFMTAIRPSVVVVSNGERHEHPRKAVIEERILSLDPAPAVYMTNRSRGPDAWPGEAANIADDDLDGYDGIIELAVWRRTFRVFKWRNGNRMDSGTRYYIKARDE